MTCLPKASMSHDAVSQTRSAAPAAQVPRLRQESLCCAGTTLRCRQPLTFTLPGMPLPLWLSLLPTCCVFGILPSVAHQACSYLRDFSVAALCLERSFLRNLHDHLLLPDEESTQMSPQRYFPWPPRVKSPYPPHLPHRSLSSLAVLFACLLSIPFTLC